MADFFSIINDIRKEAFTEKDKGDRFEKLVKNYFLSSRKYAEIIEKVWLWGEFPYRKEFGGKDTGIDIVVLTKDNEYWAVQCKCYDKGTVINKPAVDSFLATSSRTFTYDNFDVKRFSARYWIATNNKWGSNAKEAFLNQEPPAYILNPWDIANDESVDWEKLDAGINGFCAVHKKIMEVLPHQVKAWEKGHSHYLNETRGKLIMACGTGKTFTALRLCELETGNKGLILLLVPSIALINQTLNEWHSCSEQDIYPIVVCSDKTASKKREADDAGDIGDLAMPACTNPYRVAEQLIKAKEKANNMIVVYSTYQSIDVIGDAQKILCGGKNSENDSSLFDENINPNNIDFSFDFIVCDEAHRTTGAKVLGNEESHFTKVHSDDNVRGKRRLYMTATPRLYDGNAKKKADDNDIVLWSMDDETIYGKEIYRIGFGEAVDKNLLSDYKVLILTVRENTNLPADLLQAVQDPDREISADDAVKLVGVINALSKRVVPNPDIVKSIDPALMHRAVAFCSKISVSKTISSSFNAFSKSIHESFDFANTTNPEDDKRVIVQARHIDGSMNANERNELVYWLRNAPTDGEECRILTNVRCLSEGVDVPSLDAVIFLSRRNSQVDVVQSVGRVMRKAPGKKYGYIIIPVIITDTADENIVLDNNEDYAVIWTVLNALRAHDDRFNAYINKLDVNEQKQAPGSRIVIGGGDGSLGGSDGGNIDPTQLVLFDDRIQQAIYAKMVAKVGTKRYWEQWADDIAKIAKKHMERIEQAIAENEDYKTGFDMYMDGLHKNINPNITQDSAIEMLAQHFIAKPVFEALFENYSFVQSNPVSKSMKMLLDLMEEHAYDKEQNEVMDRFYKSVRERCEGIDNAAGKQKVIVELYDKFFKKALAKTVEKLGIVYTPVEVVDFINQSVADVLKKEFNHTLSDENVHIIDPFTGTGTFISRMIQSGLINKEALPRKYANELHANEIVLLAYYIASVNIENAYHEATEESPDAYTPFDGLCLTDTFQLYEDTVKGKDMAFKKADVFPENSERVIKQSELPIMVCVGNPPYSVGQSSANDNAQNETYKNLEDLLAKKYAETSKATNKNALYDSYVKAFLWASQRLDTANGGVIGFVTNAGWLDGNAMEGMRKCFEREFSSIYVYNLKGNQRTSGERSRKEGGKIFGSGSRAPIAITILVRNPKTKNVKATIYYNEVDDYLTREEKLDIIVKQKSVLAKGFTQKILKPNEHGDWLNLRSDVFGNYIVIEPEKKFDAASKSIFSVYSMGIGTSRDAWIYNYSKSTVKNNIKRMIDTYNLMVKTIHDDKDLNRNPKDISWSSSLMSLWKRKCYIQKKNLYLRKVMYRPFCETFICWCPELIHRVSRMNSIFVGNEKNLTICISSAKGLSALICDHVSDLHMVGDSQCFPLYWYEEKNLNATLGNLFSDTASDEGPEYIRHDGITDWILGEAKTKYKSNSVTKEDIFYYVYGLLHSQQYITQFEADLKKMLPRIPLVDKVSDFKAFSKAGRELADLHLNFENLQAPSCVKVENKGNNLTVNKIRFKSKNDKSTIIYNDQVTISKIPIEAYEYVVNGRSAIEWIIERYQVKTDKDSGIKNDPNDWAIENNDPKYILKLLLSIITVSIETIKIVKNLPKIEFD